MDAKKEHSRVTNQTLSDNKKKNLSLILLSFFLAGALFMKKMKKKKDRALPVATVVIAIYRYI